MEYKTIIKPINFIEEDLLSEYFYDVNNGITLCKQCHRERHKKNGR